MIDDKKVTGISSDLHSILYSNRAFANISMKKWADAEKDCSAALTLKEQNAKARYRRATARYELGNAEGALEDVNAVLEELIEAKNRTDALELKKRIEEKLNQSIPNKATKPDSPKVEKPKEVVPKE